MFINKFFHVFFWLGIVILLGVKSFTIYKSEYLPYTEKKRIEKEAYLFLEQDVFPVLKNVNYKGLVQLLEPTRYQQLPSRGFEALYRKTAQVLGSFVETSSFKEEQQGLLASYKRQKTFLWHSHWVKTDARIEIRLTYKNDRWWIYDIAIESEKLELVQEAANEANRTGFFDEKIFYQSLSGLR